ncbi:MAG: C1 family peptidase [Lewinellaceae bacterium]|nr:C1 family peptidase [Lewinellaceae bacterium]
MGKIIPKYTAIICLLCLTVGQVSWAQQFNTGLVLDDEGFRREVEMTPGFTNDGRRAGDLPLRFSLRPYCPTPKNQGEINSCIGWAMGYGALTISYAYREGNTDQKEITKQAFSALYLYNQAKMGNCMGGANIQQTAKILKDKGNCPSKEFDSPLADCDREPDETLIGEAQKHAIKDYIALFNNSSAPKDKVVRTKRSLAEGKPVIVGMKIRESLKILTSDAPVWQPGGEADKPMGGHALVVVGYNDSSGVFDLLNSWGPNWGDNGFFQVRYKDFAENAAQGLQLILSEENLTPEQIAVLKAQYQQATAVKKDAAAKQQDAARQKELAAAELKKAEAEQAEAKIKAAQEQFGRAAEQEQVAMDDLKRAEYVIAEAADRMVALSGEFLVRMPETDDYGTLILDEAGQQKFRNLKPAWNGTFYTLDKTDWQEGDGFQIIARNIKKDRYVYLFSFDGNEKLEVHWPRTLRAEIDGKPNTGETESALVAHKGAEIVIPGEDRVLTRENLLDDNICVLYAFDKIGDIRERLSRLNNLSGPFENRLRQAFGDLFVASNLIEYGKQDMSCKTEAVGRGSVIPILVKIQNE